ncbi:hypothetical protein, conserved [Eimeria praecox]|uniref:Uncharacterized protein n=1 Tax=Eimeria praecox TaxID=51316 RepID=U6H609_9EIME|nr:hypothetical protein, conserved [Eimeria praecox]
MAATPHTDRISLAEAKDQRKQAELDAQLLANRIALLRQEDAKARKKVEQLMQKTRTLDEIRQRERKRQEFRLQQQAERERQVLEIQQANAAQRERDKKARDEARRRQTEAKRQDVLRAKREHALAAEQRRHYDEEQQEYNMQRSQQVRREQQLSRERRRLEQQRRLEETHSNYDARVAEEERKWGNSFGSEGPLRRGLPSGSKRSQAKITKDLGSSEVKGSFGTPLTIAEEAAAEQRQPAD